MADKEDFERGTFANSMYTRSCITPKDNVDERNVVAHFLTKLLLQHFYLSDMPSS